MRTYPKINSLWKREGWYFDADKKNNPEFQKGRQQFIVGDYACPEFGLIKEWNVTEKIDGTNIRIFFVKKDGILLPPAIYGREDSSLIPGHLMAYLQTIIPLSFFYKAFPNIEKDDNFEVCLFGEGYGPKIQKTGALYRECPGFILFDCVVGSTWLNRKALEEVASALVIPCVPLLGIMTEDVIVEYIKSKPTSIHSAKPQRIEGIVARTDPMIMFRDGKPIMFKLKCKDFE